MLLRLGRGMTIGYPGAQRSAAGGAYLDSVLASVCCDLDATIAGSYPGSGTTWANLIESPADGADPTDYNLTNNGFTFTGTAGDSGAYFLSDGDDYFQIGSNTTLINGFHHTTGSSGWWIAVAFRFNDDGAGFVSLFSTTSGAPGEGVRLLLADASFKPRLNMDRGSSRTNNDFAGHPNPVDGTDYIIILSGDPTSSDGLRMWMDSVAAEEDMDASAGASIANASGNFTLGAGTDGLNSLGSGSRVYHMSMGNEFLDDTKAALIIAHLEARHGRDYAP